MRAGIAQAILRRPIVTVNAIGTKQYVNGATSVSYTGLTILPGFRTALIVTVGWDIVLGAADPNISSMTWGGVALARIKSGAATVGTGPFAELWGLVNPLTGNQTLAASWTGSLKVFFDAIAFNGVDQSGGSVSFPNSVSLSSASIVTVASASGNKVVASVVTGGAIGTITGTTIFSDAVSGTTVNSFANFGTPNGASLGIGSSGTDISIVATDVKAA